MAAGKLDRRIAIERFNENGRNEYNEPIKTWEAFTTISAKKTDLSDREKLSAGQVNSVRMSRFVIRYSTKSRTISPKDRIRFDGLIWDINGIKEVSEKRKRYIELTALAQSD